MTLKKTSFKLNSKDFDAFKLSEIKEIEWIVFSHQFGQGLDTIGIEVKTKKETYKSDLIPNIYSAYGLVTIKNIVFDGDKVKGDLLISTYSYNPNSSLPHDIAIRNLGNVSSQVGINLVGPSSEAIAADLEEKNISLEDFTWI